MPKFSFSRQQLQFVALTGLGLVCVMVYVRAFRITPAPAVAPHAPAASPAPQTASIPAAETATASPATRAAQRTYAGTLAWSRDPFLRGGGQVSTGLNLSGIIWDHVRPMAMINGTPVTVGEEVEGFRVVDIQSDRVTLTDGTTTHQLRVSP